MSRSKWKGVFVQSNLFKMDKNKTVKISSRSSVITNDFLNKRIMVYNGKEFKPVYIVEEKIGFKFGEFTFTRKNIQKYKKNVKKLKKK